MVPWSEQDTIGVAITAAVIMGPIALISYFFDNVSKDAPIGPLAYLLPCGLGLVLTALSSAAVLVVGRTNIERLGLHIFFGCLVSLLLLTSFCCGWGSWWFEYIERFRAVGG
jgi:hypothetical protein